MAKNSPIEWTDATWNPWYGCLKVSPGCRDCYMYREQKQYGGNPYDKAIENTFSGSPEMGRRSHHLYLIVVRLLHRQSGPLAPGGMGDYPTDPASYLPGLNQTARVHRGSAPEDLAMGTCLPWRQH